MDLDHDQKPCPSGPGSLGSDFGLVAGTWGETSPALVAPWFVGRYGWILDQRRVLPEPIPCRGMQGLWTVPDDVAARLAAEETSHD